MKLKAAVLYRYEKYLKVIGLFAGLLIIPIIGALVATKKNNYPIFDRYSLYLAGICAVMSFVFGITSYKPIFKFFLQNGVSRQSTHASFILNLPVCVVLAAVECLIHNTVVLISNQMLSSANKPFTDAFADIFNYQGGVLKILVMHIIIESLAFMMLMSLGYLLSAVFSGMKHFYKVLVIAVLAVIIILSFILSAVTDSYISLGMPAWIAFILYFIFGGLGNFYLNHFISSMIILIILFTSISHLLIRKAIVRK
jgi:hypothetical protein